VCVFYSAVSKIRKFLGLFLQKSPAKNRVLLRRRSRTLGRLLVVATLLRMCCSVLQSVAACCSVMQHIAACNRNSESLLIVDTPCTTARERTQNVFKCVAVCCSVSQCVAVRRCVSQCVVTIWWAYSMAREKIFNSTLVTYVFKYDEEIYWGCEALPLNRALMCVCVCMYVCVCMCVRERVCVCIATP